MKKLILDYLVKQPAKDYYNATIVKPLGFNEYQVEDAVGKSATVFSSTQWNVGDNVVISDSKVVGRAGASKAPNTYIV